MLLPAFLLRSKPYDNKAMHSFIEVFLMIMPIDGCSCSHIVHEDYCCTKILMISNAIKV